MRSRAIVALVGLETGVMTVTEYLADTVTVNSDFVSFLFCPPLHLSAFVSFPSGFRSVPFYPFSLPELSFLNMFHSCVRSEDVYRWIHISASISIPGPSTHRYLHRFVCTAPAVPQPWLTLFW